MSKEDGKSKAPIPWPSGIKAENRTAIERNLSEHSLAVSVALAMVEETKPLIKKEFEIAFSLDPGHILDQFRAWSVYLRAAHAVLNADSILKTGKPFEEPGSDFEAIQRDNRISFSDLLMSIKDKDKFRELEHERSIAGQISWFKRELDLAALYRKFGSPLDFVDAVIKQETDRLLGQDKTDMGTVRELHEAFKELSKEKADEPGEETVDFIEGITRADTKKRIDAMELGRERFHQLYQDFNH